MDTANLNNEAHQSEAQGQANAALQEHIGECYPGDKVLCVQMHGDAWYHAPILTVCQIDSDDERQSILLEVSTQGIPGRFRSVVFRRIEI